MQKVATPNSTEENGVLTISELAALLKVSLASIYSLNHRGLGPAYIRVGKSVRYRRESVDQWLLDKETQTWRQ